MAIEGSPTPAALVLNTSTYLTIFPLPPLTKLKRQLLLLW